MSCKLQRKRGIGKKHDSGRVFRDEVTAAWCCPNLEEFEPKAGEIRRFAVVVNCFGPRPALGCLEIDHEFYTLALTK